MYAATRYASLILFVPQMALAQFDEIPQARDPVFGPIEALNLEKRILNHGFASDGILHFVAQTGAPPDETHDFEVLVYRAFGRRLVGKLPPPERGWIRPFTVKVTAESLTYGFPLRVKGHLVVLDSLIPATIGTGQQPLLVEYEYCYSVRRGFRTTKVAEHPLPLDDFSTPEVLEGMVFPTSWVTHPNGRTVVADTIGGSLWVSDENYDNWQLAFINNESAAFNPQVWPEDVTIDHDHDPTTPETTGVWAQFPDPSWDGTEIQVPYAIVPTAVLGEPPGTFVELIPGLHGVDFAAPVDSFVFVSIAPASPIGMIPADVLFDTTLPPIPAFKPYTELVPAIAGVTDWVGEIWWNEFKPDSPYVYWLRALGKTTWPDMHPNGQLPPTWYRVNLFTGKFESLKSDGKRLNVPSHHYPVPCPGSWWNPGRKWFSCAVAINVYQGFLPETNKFLLPPFTPEPDWGLFPSEHPFPMYIFAEILP